MKRFFKDTRGAVTVMVTLLLIPALLVSGTGVDIARIYAAQSAIQDGNQLAANSALASYNALLQDLYGIFGMMMEEEDFSGMAEKYVGSALGEGIENGGVGTFDLFYGSRVETTITPVAGKNLKNQEVLLRQIEEYSKFRAPVIVAELLMDKLETFEKVQEDAKVIQKKMEVDDGVEELEEYFRKIYDQVERVNTCKETEEKIMKELSENGDQLRFWLNKAEETKWGTGGYMEKLKEYEKAEANYNAASDADEADKYYAEMNEIKTKMDEKEKEYYDFIDKAWMVSSTIYMKYTGWSDFYTNESSYEEQLNEYKGKGKKGLDTLLIYCQKAEAKKKELQDKIREMKESLGSGKCSDELVSGFTEPNEEDGRSVIERYEALLDYNIEDMGNKMHDPNYAQIEATIEVIKEARLGNHLLIDYRDLDYDVEFPLDSETDGFSFIPKVEVSWKPAVVEGKEFTKFKDIDGECKDFYEELVTIYSQTEGNGADKDTLKKSVTKIFSKAQDMFKKLVFAPEGAMYLTGGEDTSDSSTGTDFGSAGDWSNEDEGKDQTKKALGDDFLGMLAKTASDVGNKVLLMVYDTEMFSDASTPGKKEEGYPKENMAGIPLSTDVNYYFQSELEYLYNGNLSSATANLASVAGMIFLVRFVFNYVASFTVKSVKAIVAAVEEALAWTGPFAILAGELARLALVLGESTMDVVRLREGDQVAIFKSDSTWKLSISGLTDAAKNVISDAVIDSALDVGSSNGDDDGATLGYTDYIRLFLLLVPNEKLAARTANLIELNMTNKMNNVNADEYTMAKTERFDLSKAVTDFGITTKVDLRMLFLSMSYAQNAIDGVTPPKSIPVTVIDYRGY